MDNELKLLFSDARKDYSSALNLLAILNLYSSTIEDVMYGYMIANDWNERCKNPDFSGNDSLFGSKTISITKTEAQPLSEIFEDYASRLAEILKTHRLQVEDVFQNLIMFGYPYPGIEHLPQELYYRSLRLTAKLYENDLGDTYPNQILDRENVPALN